MATPLSENEQYILSFYRASELAGGLLMGKLAFHTDLEELRSPLTRHAAEEMHHAWLWTETLDELGFTLIKITRTYQTEYCGIFGLPTQMLEILGLTQVLEKRALEQYQAHLQKDGLHPLVKKTLEEIIGDETGHLHWIEDIFATYEAQGHHDELAALRGRLEDVDRKAYANCLLDKHFSTFFPASTV